VLRRAERRLAFELHMLVGDVELRGREVHRADEVVARRARLTRRELLRHHLHLRAVALVRPAVPERGVEHVRDLRLREAAERDGALCALELEAGARADELAIDLDEQLALARLPAVVLRADLAANLDRKHARGNFFKPPYFKHESGRSAERSYRAAPR
jgi:hypothetical protein